MITSLGDLTFNDVSIASDAHQDADAGAITVASFGEIRLVDSQINSNTSSTGAAGAIQLESNTGIVLAGPEVLLAATSTANGRAGNINLDAPDIEVTQGAEISTATTANGRAGVIQLDAEILTVNTISEILAASSGSGDGGDIEINADVVQLSESSLTVNSQGQGVGGSILVTGDLLFLEQGSAIDAATASSDGGNVALNFTDVVLLSDQSEITATAGLDQGDGNGGNIDIQSEFLVGQPEGQNQIIANAFEGNGGNINITATSILGEPFLNISASSQLGLPGTVTLDSPDIDPSSSLAELPTSRVNASTLIADFCAVDGHQRQSQFVVTGPGGLPIRPTSDPTGLFLLPDLGPLGAPPPAASTAMPQEAQGWSVAANGDIVLAAAPVNPLETMLWEANQAYQQADYAQAATLWTEAAAALDPSENTLAYASTLSNLALAYHHLGEWDQAQAAIATTRQVLTPEIATDQPWLLAQALNTQASLQLARGNAQAALSDWQQAAEAYGQAGDDGGQLRVVLNQTQAWQALGFHQRATEQLEAIATALAEQPPSSVQAMTLLNLGTMLRMQGEAERSQQTLEAALAVTEPLPQPHLTSAILLNLGHTAQVQANSDQALAYYQQALATAPTPLGQFQAQVSQLNLLVSQNPSAAQALWSTLEPQLQEQTMTLPASRDAIYAQLNLAATLLQPDHSLASPEQISALLNTAGYQAQQIEDSLAQAYTLGYQAQVYRQMQEWAEAEVLTAKALQQAQILEAPAMIYQWAEQLGQVRRAQGDRRGAITAYTEAVNALRVLRVNLNAASDDVQFTFRDTVEPVYRELVKLLLQGEAGRPDEQANLEQARLLIEDLQLAELQDYFQDGCVQGEPMVADDVDPTAAVIYPIVLDDRLDVIVSVAGQPMHHHSTPIEPGQVEQTVQGLLRSLTTPLGSGQANTTQQLQQVYNWLIAPVEANLEQHSIETLVFVADGILRTLPLTALHNGEAYLIERYNVVTSPGLNLLDPSPLERQGLQMLAGGLSEARPGFPPLPFVEDEIQQITAQIPNHQVLFNQDLTRNNLTASLATAPAGVIHLATHGTFGSTAEDTFILTWDGEVTIKELGALLQTRNRSSALPIELLVFSACKTATGDSRAVLGIAGMAMRSGVRSTVAGLWPLNDQATAVFMDHFYEALAQPATTKAEAFRQAQLALLQDSRFNTPYYWGPFVMVGNWL